MVFAMASLVVGATRAYFSDTETSTGNTFAAGTLDLNVDGGNTNVVKFTVTDMKPGDTQTGTWTLRNAGSIAGYLDLHSIAQVHGAGTTTEPELAEENPDVGTLGSLLTANLFVDTNGNGVQDGVEPTIYSGSLGGMASEYPDLDLSLAAGATNYVTLVLNWTPSANDNKGQGDTVNLGMTFELGQTLAQ